MLSQSGVLIMKRRYWLLVLVLLGAVLCLSSVQRSDDPETAMNESDLQVSLAPPAQIGLRALNPVGTSILPRPLRSDQYFSVRDTRNESIPLTIQSRSHSIQKLLCTFLI
jgi:hypothetical protein